MLLALAFVGFSAQDNAFAKKKMQKKMKKEKQEMAQSYEANYGMAGCGLGSLIIKNKRKWPQLGAAVLNAVGYQTFAITSGSSNCVDKGKDYAQKEKEVFVTINLPSLEKEAAQGQGQHLSAFAEILGCPSHEAFADFSQNNFKSIFNSQQPDTVLKNYIDEIKKDEQLQNKCIRLG